MTKLGRNRYVFLAVLFVALGAVFWFGNDPELEFRPHPRLDGFRELVFDGRYSKKNFCDARGATTSFAGARRTPL